MQSTIKQQIQKYRRKQADSNHFKGSKKFMTGIGIFQTASFNFRLHTHIKRSNQELYFWLK